MSENLNGLCIILGAALVFVLLVVISNSPSCQPCTKQSGPTVYYVPRQPRGPVYAPAPQPPIMVNPGPPVVDENFGPGCPNQPGEESEYYAPNSPRRQPLPAPPVGGGNDDELIGAPINAQRGGRR